MTHAKRAVSRSKVCLCACRIAQLPAAGPRTQATPPNCARFHHKFRRAILRRGSRAGRLHPGRKLAADQAEPSSHTAHKGLVADRWGSSAPLSLRARDDRCCALGSTIKQLAGQPCCLPSQSAVERGCTGWDRRRPAQASAAYGSKVSVCPMQWRSSHASQRRDICAGSVCAFACSSWRRALAGSAA
jgi:hypothetical protein